MKQIQAMALNFIINSFQLWSSNHQRIFIGSCLRGNAVDIEDVELEVISLLKQFQNGNFP